MECLVVIGAIIVGFYLLAVAMVLLIPVAVGAFIGWIVSELTGLPLGWTVGIAMVIGLIVGIIGLFD